jgi:hypothetical protein
MSNEAQSADREVAEAHSHVRKLTHLAYIGAAAAVVVLTVYATNFFGPLSSKTESWGQFGDYVGGLLNPTFSFLALLALLATLGLQVRELRLSVRELANSADALSKQNETLRQQTFEGTFFQSLRLHNDIVATMEVLHLSLTGRACFPYYLKELEGILESEAATKDLGRFVFHYDFFYREHQVVLGHYFRMLYNLVKLVHRAEGLEKRFYTNMVRAQLSSAELQLLFYNCLSSWGNMKFKPLVEEYALLKTLPTDVLPDDALLHAYSPTAFGGKYPESWL